MKRKLYERGDRVIITQVDNRLASFGFRAGDTHNVWCDYEDLIYLDTPVKGKTSDDYFYPEQIMPA